MAQASNSFGRKAILSMAAAAAMATYAVAPTPSEAGEPIAPACVHAGDEIAQLKCSIAVSKKVTAGYKAETAANIARGKAADARIKAADDKISDAKKTDELIASAEYCFNFLKQGIGANKFKREEVLAAASGKVTVENACPVAARYGYERRASAEAPQVR